MQNTIRHQRAIRRNPFIYNVLSRPFNFHPYCNRIACPRYQSTASAQQSNAQTSVDPTEVSHFNNLAGTWWDPHGPSRLLHLMNPMRHSFISECLANTTSTSKKNGLDYLDIGCGGGIFAESAARLPHTASVTAIDPSPKVLKVAEAHKRKDPLLLEPGRLTYLNASIENFNAKSAGSAYKEDGYDVVTLFEVLEHVTDGSAFLTSILPHVKVGGWLVLSTISRTWTSWVVTKLVAEDVLGMVPQGTHDWEKYVNEDELAQWFEKQQGWGNARSMGCMYIPGVGWKEVAGGEKFGNYFFAAQRLK
jgi:polyprenyldihydroxybenzoate methyltransferase / 3-demethylubiquinol 3-O-methyltransferase